jgi:hypothetical protein
MKRKHLESLTDAVTKVVSGEKIENINEANIRAFEKQVQKELVEGFPATASKLLLHASNKVHSDIDASSAPDRHKAGYHEDVDKAFKEIRKVLNAINR